MVIDNRTHIYWVRQSAKILLLSSSYVVGAHLGAALAYTRAPVVAIWLPAGIGLAIMLLGGWKCWPAVTIGAFAATLTTGGPWLVAPGVALGATLEAAIAYVMLTNRKFDFRQNLGRVRDIYSLAAAAVIAPVVSTSIGSATLWIYHGLAPGSVLQTWKTWWIGDFLGILLLTPLLLAWHLPLPLRRGSWNLFEAGFLLAAISGLSWLAFSSDQPLVILLAPALLWVALRFGQRGSSLSLLIVSCTAIWHTYRGLGPFISGSVENSLFALQIFIAVGSITILFLGAATTERDVVQEALRQARDELEQKVVERTARLGEANARLALELAERERAETERRMLEAQMLQTQKLESLGLLAGGIAHDFNNILTAILGHADLALDNLPEGSVLKPHIEEISLASHRAAELAGQMLSYSGRGKFVMISVNLTVLIKELLQLLQASISKKAQLDCRLADDLPLVEGDPTQLRQVVMNLILNASEAIRDGSGRIEVCTKHVNAETAGIPADGWLGDAPRSGRYVALEVSDTGCGMNAETCSKIFDPFFSTKSTGRGLGLATVLGIVRGHGGCIRVESRPDCGTTFVVLLVPSSNATAAVTAPPAAAGKSWTGSGTVLIVDDEESVRNLAKAMVERCGFKTVLAVDGRDALNIFRGREKEFICILLDLTMPRMDGIETLKELRRMRPDVAVVLSSGYPQQEHLNGVTGSPHTSFIQKPYRLVDLAATLQDAIK